MKALVGSQTLDVVSFFGMMTGIALLLVGFFVEDLRVLAIPGLALLFPSMIYGMR
jgi:hypothetical protein